MRAGVGELCLREVATIAPDDTLGTAARRMRDTGMDELVVVQRVDGDERPLGVLTEHDLVVSVLAADVAEPSRLRVRDVLRDSFVAVTTDEDVDETLHRMRRLAVRRLPVVDRAGVLYGVVTLDDL